MYLANRYWLPPVGPRGFSSRGWPGVEDPIWSNVSYGVEGALVSFMINGTVEGIPR